MYGDLRAALESLAPVIGLALLGGAVRLCRFGTTSWKQLPGSLSGSAFAGILANWMLADTELSPSVVSAIIATAGYSGGSLLDAAQARLVSAVGLTGAAFSTGQATHEVAEMSEESGESGAPDQADHKTAPSVVPNRGVKAHIAQKLSGKRQTRRLRAKTAPATPRKNRAQSQSNHS